ncbi:MULTISPECIES: hypothetical protein [Sphingomonas]|uniref:Uncharacterized protein n=1 Tax=Sphingomonas molluscorum TaxID=418184 RepID=A0ABU8Q3F0_9SPHN|nr:hypothetical protein [Sphingomonas sp. JUb134]MBM7405697.1 hypothetical protein [Sphingomonas sp. JUb134]
MNYVEHILVALLVQSAVGLFSGNWWAGAGVASTYFISRELAQAEYRWIEQFGHGLRSNMPWWGPFDRRVWTTLDQWVDWLGPLIVTFGLAWFLTRYVVGR